MDFNRLHSDQVQFLESVLFEGLGKETPVNHYQFLSGGNINLAVQVDTDAGSFFVKWNENAPEDLFSCEAKGLALLRATNTVAVPQVLAYGQHAQRAYLLMEYIQSPRPQTRYWENLGEQLANLHRHSQSHFGLDHNNYIGSLRQSNEPQTSWVNFFIERRLQVQASLAWYNGQLPVDLYKRFDDLYKKLPELLPDEKPALLHGDLWSGNVLVGNDGEACLIDPAVYYGNREADLAFTRLFGGFAPVFYDAYREAFPLEPGFERRTEIYNLYPLLVHVNLFGSGYLSGVERVLRKF